MPQKATVRPAAGEGDVNTSPRRTEWSKACLGQNSRELVERDAREFLRQSVSTPCLSAIRRSEGVWIEDCDGRRFLDFHGNNVHHIGHAHPRLIGEITAQLGQLTFRARRFTCAPAVELAERLAELARGDLDKVLLRRAALTPLKLPLPMLALPPADSRPFRSGIRITVRASRHAASVASKCFAAPRLGRCCPVLSSCRRLATIAMLGMCLRAAVSCAPRLSAMYLRRKVMYVP